MKAALAKGETLTKQAKPEKPAKAAELPPIENGG